MKFVLAVVAAFTLAVVGGVHAMKNSSNTNKAPAEVLNLNNNTVSGNITDELKSSDESALVNDKKLVSKLNLNSKRVVHFNQTFSRGTVAYAVSKLKKLEAQSNEPIWLLINSPGGSVIDGAELISQMEASKAPVYTVCMKLCASMAAMTHSYGAKRYSLDRALIMYHPATAGVEGQVPNMLSLLKTLTRYIDKMNANIVKRSNLSKQEFEALVAYELWIDSEDALKRGLIDGIVSLNVEHEEVLTKQEDQAEDKSKSPPRVKFQLISPYAKDLW